MSTTSLVLGLWLCAAPPASEEPAGARPPSEAAAGAGSAESEPSADETEPETKKNKKKNTKKKKKKKRKAPDDPNRLEWGVLPAISYDIDLGLGFGALVTLAKFHPDFKPYRWRLEILGHATVKNIPGVGIRFPFHDDYIKADFPGLLGGRVRINAFARFRRFTNQGWYGIGNASEYLKPWEELGEDATSEQQEAARRYNQYDRIYPQLDLNTRIILWDRSEIDEDRRRACGPKYRKRCPPHAYRGAAGNVQHKQRLEALVGTSIGYNVINPYPNSKLSQDIALAESETEDGATLRGLLHGTENHALWTLNFGLLYDTRDHEYVPTRGSFTELSGRISPGVDENLTFGHLYLAHSMFAPLYGDYLVFGARGALDFLFGRPPLYELGRYGVLSPTDGPGGSWSIRGVPRQRYFGKRKAIANFELRSMFVRFDIVNQRFGVGALAFVDAGRLWTDYGEPVQLEGRNIDGPFSDIKVGLGGGLRITWGETLVIRVDPAYSPTDENFGFYLDINQMF